MPHDPQSTMLDGTNQRDTKCPACQGDGTPFEVEEGRSYRRVSYRCAKCHYTWAQTTALAADSTIHE
jgi:transposase-like protein